MTTRRHRAAIAACRHHHLANVDVAVRVQPDVVRREEIARSARIGAAAPTRQQPALEIEHAHPPARRVGTGRAQPGEQARTPADLGLLVRRVRNQRQLSQDELARLLGVTQRYLSELENGKPKLADERFFRILRSMGVVVTASTDGAAPDHRPAYRGPLDRAERAPDA